MLNMTGCKSYTNYIKNPIEADHNYELIDKKFEAESRNVLFYHQSAAYKKAIVKIFPTDIQ